MGKGARPQTFKSVRLRKSHGFLALDASQRFELCNRSRDPGQRTSVDNVGNVFVGLRDFLVNRAAALSPNDNASCFHLTNNVTARGGLLRLYAAHRTPGTVAGATERLVHRFFGPGKHVRVTAHVAGDQNRLSDRLIFPWDFLATGSKRSSSSFAMHAQMHLASIYRMRFKLGDIVGNFVNGAQFNIRHAYAECFRESFPSLVGNHLAVCKSVIYRTTHCAQIVLSFWGIDRRTGQLPIW